MVRINWPPDEGDLDVHTDPPEDPIPPEAWLPMIPFDVAEWGDRDPVYPGGAPTPFLDGPSEIPLD